MVAATQTDGPSQRWFSTDRELKALKPAPAGELGSPKRRYIVWDATQPHLGIRVTETGARSFVVVRRLPGARNPVTYVLGSYPALTLKAAREAAPGVLATIVGGKHPREVEAEQQRASARKRRDTLATAVAAFIEDEQTKGLRSSGETETVLRREFLGQTWRRVEIERDGIKKRIIEWHNGREPIWRDRPILEITRRDVIERLDAIKRRRGRYAARHALGAIRKFFNWCAEGERFGIETSPCANIRDKTIGIKGKDLKRRRVLDNDELRDVWQAAEEGGSPDAVVPGYRAYSRAHEISAQGKTAISGSSDPVFRGDAVRWNPAELLIAALSACHQLWYLHLCADAGVVVVAYSDDASGVEIEQADGAGQFESVTLRPHAKLAAGSDENSARRLHDAAAEKCFIARSV